MNNGYLLWRDWYSTDEMRDIWAETSVVNSWLRVEVAISEALADEGVIPKTAARSIENLGSVTLSTIEGICNHTASTRHIIAGFVDYMRAQLGEAGEYFHLGATTQDILDTGLALQIGKSIDIVARDLKKLMNTLLEIANKHRSTLMVGRSQGQHALPITFGFKCALWASELADNLRRQEELRKRVLIVSNSAAVGSQASYSLLLGQHNTIQFTERICRRLGLHLPLCDIHGRVDRFSELVNYLALVATFLGRIGLDLRDLQRTEVAEIKNKWVDSHKGSSTLVHKQNPEPAHWLEGLAKIVRGNSVAMMDIQVQHERDATRTAPEFAVISESFLCLSSALRIANDIFLNLDVDSAKMLANLNKSKGLIMSEPAWIELFKKNGQLAFSQGIVKSCVATARIEEKSLEEILLKQKDFIIHFSPNKIREMLNPENYLGTINDQIDLIIQQVKADSH